MAYELEKNVTMPGRTRSSVYPWNEMGVNNSFFVEGKLKRIIVPIRLRKLGFKFEQAVMRKDGPESPVGLRVKRVK